MLILYRLEHLSNKKNHTSDHKMCLKEKKRKVLSLPGHDAALLFSLSLKDFPNAIVPHKPHTHTSTFSSDRARFRRTPPNA